MERTRTALLLLTLNFVGSACGDSSSPVPPVSAAAASVAVLAGDGQSVPAGEPVPVPPAVVVRDQDGNPFRGATVRFSVSEGGGTVEGDTQTTDASGVARVTSWTMGNSGPQRIAAAVGSLTPASIAASILPGTEITAEVVPPTGGVITISTPGHPYEGLELDVPSGTFPAAASMRLRLAPNAELPAMPAGYRVGGPALEITTDAPRGGELMELDVPVAQQSGEAAVLVYIDPARGSMEVLPTVARSTTSVRAVTTHLRADLLLGPAPASSSPLAGAQGLGSVTGYLVPVIHSMVQPAVSQLYDPSTSGWPIVDHGSAAIPDGFGPTIPATQVMASNLGIVPAAIVKGLSTAGFYADAGILASVQAAAHTPGITSDQMDALFSKFAGLPKDVRDEYVRQNLTASLALQGQPGFVALFNSATGPTASETWFATTVASSGVGVTLSQAAEPETGVLGHAANGFGTVLVKKAGDGPSTTVDGALPMSSFVFDYTKTSPVIETLKRFEGLTLDERRVVNDEVRAAFGLPKAVFETESVQGAGYTLHPGGAFIVRGDVFNVRLADPQTGLWIHDPNEGPAPGPGGVSIPYDDPNGRLDFVTLPGLPGFGVNVGSLVGLGGQDPLIRAITSITKATAPLVRQVAPEQVDIVSAPFKVTPDTALTATDSTVTFQADVPSPPAGGFRVRWDWGDGTTSDSVGSTGATHRYDPPGDYTATATLLSADGSRVLAVDTLQVKAPASPHWRLTWMEDTDTLGWSAVVPITVLLRDAIANPGSAMLSLDETSSGGTVLQLRVLAGGTWTTNNCCTRFAPALAGETRAPLGAMPSFVSPFGPLFNGYKATHWNQSTPDLGAGTMFGRANLGTFSYNVRNFGVQQGPQFVLQLEATRTGTTMVGTVSLIFWPIVDLLPNETIQYVELTPDFYRFNFLAERIR